MLKLSNEKFYIIFYILLIFFNAYTFLDFIYTIFIYIQLDIFNNIFIYIYIYIYLKIECDTYTFIHLLSTTRFC